MPTVKYLLWLGMLVWPTWASFGDRGSTFGTAVVIALVISVLGALIGRAFPHDVGAIALVGLAGGGIGIVIGLAVGLIAGYWGGFFVSTGFVVSCLFVAYLVKRYFSPIGVVVRI